LWIFFSQTLTHSWEQLSFQAVRIDTHTHVHTHYTLVISLCSEIESFEFRSMDVCFKVWSGGGFVSCKKPTGRPKPSSWGAIAWLALVAIVVAVVSAASDVLRHRPREDHTLPPHTLSPLVHFFPLPPPPGQEYADAGSVPAGPNCTKYHNSAIYWWNRSTGKLIEFFPNVSLNQNPKKKNFKKKINDKKRQQSNQLTHGELIRLPPKMGIGRYIALK
jgi:hypothetical protein